MKLLIICFALVVAALARNFEPYELECINELGIDKSILEGIDAPIDNPDFHRFTGCVWKKQGMMKDDGEINWDKFHDFILKGLGKSDAKAEDIVKRAIDSCRDVHGDSHGDTAIKVLMCVDVQLRSHRSELEN
ncbi:hypothetical protein ILUMI_10213 [Ignelater luminosus]|uniref:Uncharacterized protein n=1 Tax=Ignelater luminosus TaxID=2038154 RepID=A0A8K0G8W8_IGNLU|nr:hypothetical protein ILUMI_10213 [Ignelater luminosus]